MPRPIPERKTPKYLIIPTNDNQELNYDHTFTRPLKEAKMFGEYMRDQLQKILTQGSIGILIRDQSEKDVAFLPTTGHVWKKRS